MALVGIGDLSEDSNMVRMGWFSPQEVAEARLSGTIGDIMGYDFIDIHGRASSANMQGRVIGKLLQAAGQSRRVADRNDEAFDAISEEVLAAGVFRT